MSYGKNYGKSMSQHMSKEICFLIETPLTRRDYERFGVEILRSRGFHVSFLDLTGILNPDYVKNYEPPDPSDYKDIVIMHTWHEVEDYLKNNRVFLAVELIGGASLKNISIYRILKKYNIKYASFCTNCPNYKSTSTGLSEMTKATYEKLNGLNIIDIARKVARKTRLAFNLLSVQHPALVLKGGRAQFSKLPKPSNGAKVVSAHALDYDLYLKHHSRIPGSSMKNNCIVFLDEYNPFHPDFMINKDDAFSLDPRTYYGGLNRFFSHIEKRMGLPVKIAAHPRARYDLHPDYFQGREVISGKTLELIFDAKDVLAHASTSINFAVLYRKPLIFLTSDEINATNYAILINNSAGQFAKKPVNVDGDPDIYVNSNDLQVDNDIYDKYYSNFIKIPGTPEKPFWEIVADNLVSIA